MPRLTNLDYLSIRHFLVRLWRQSDGSSFAALPAYAQRELHDYFAFTVSMNDEDALTYRVEMTAAFPSLPQSAGRALEALRAHLEGRPHRLFAAHRKASSQMGVIAGSERTVRVDAVSRPDVDVEALARALRQLADREDTDV